MLFIGLDPNDIWKISKSPKLNIKGRQRRNERKFEGSMKEHVTTTKFKGSKILSVTSNGGQFMIFSPFSDECQILMQRQMIRTIGGTAWHKLVHEDVVYYDKMSSFFSIVNTYNERYIVKEGLDESIKREVIVPAFSKLNICNGWIVISGGMGRYSYKFNPIDWQVQQISSPPEWNNELMGHRVFLSEDNQIVVVGGEFRYKGEKNDSLYFYSTKEGWDKVTTNWLDEGEIVASYLLGNFLLILKAYTGQQNHNLFSVFNFSTKENITLKSPVPFMERVDIIILKDWKYSYFITSGYCNNANKNKRVIPVALIKLICLFYDPQWLILVNKMDNPMTLFSTDLTNIIELDRENKIYIS